MVQLSTSVYLLGGLLGLFLLSPVLMAPTPASMCTPLRTLNDSLSHRRRYMKHYFPINYTIRVHQEEVFKLSNINRLRLEVEGLDELVLQRLWFQVNQGVLKKIIRVMPERHPSRPYTAELERRFRDAEGVFVQSHPAEVFQQELPESIQDTWDNLTEEPDRVPESSWRFVTPKSLLDNFCQTMHCLFSECFATTEPLQDCEYNEWCVSIGRSVQFSYIQLWMVPFGTIPIFHHPSFGVLSTLIWYTVCSLVRRESTLRLGLSRG